MLCMVGAALALAGHDREARQIQAELKARSAREYVSPCLRANVLIALGEVDDDFTLLEEAAEQHDTALPTILIWTDPWARGGASSRNTASALPVSQRPLEFQDRRRLSSL